MQNIHILRCSEGHVDHITVIIIHTGADGFDCVTNDALIAVKALHGHDGSLRCYSGDIDMIILFRSNDTGHKSAMTFRIIGTAVVIQVIISGDHIASY